MVGCNNYLAPTLESYGMGKKPESTGRNISNNPMDKFLEATTGVYNQNTLYSNTPVGDNYNPLAIDTNSKILKNTYGPLDRL